MKTIRIAILVGMACCAFYISRGLLIGAQSDAVLNLAPFVLTTTDYVMQNGKEVDTMDNTMERRQDGSVNMVGTRLQGPEIGKQYRKIELANGFEGMILPDLKIKETGYMDAAQLAGRKARLASPPADCIDRNDTLIARTKLMGQDAIELVHLGGDQSSRRLEWRFSAFSCVAVQLQIQRQGADGQWETTLGKRLDSFHAGDPPEGDFSGWESFQEMRPSDVKRAIAQRDGITKAQCPKCFEDDSVGDKKYAAMQRSTP
jgi:hypothetical protein